MSESLKAYPRVLVVNGEPFSHLTASGLTLSSLFKGWPKEALGCLFISDVEPAEDVCQRYWRLTAAEMPAIGVALRILGVPFPGAHLVTAGGVEGNTRAEATPAARRRRMPLYQIVRGVARSQSVVHLFQYRIPRNVLSEIVGFRPDVIYSMLGPNSVLQMVLAIQELCGVPIVPHFMDDWASTLYRRSVFRPILRGRMKRYLASVLTKSPERMTIGPQMAEEYAHRYGGTFRAFMKAVEVQALASSEAPPTTRGTVRLTYVGGLHLNRWRSLRDVGRGLRLLRQEGLKVTLLVYTQPRFSAEAAKLDMPDVIEFGGSLDPSEVPRVLREADILVHVESFDRSSRRYARYSVSTKIPECLAAGKAILAYGPGELASIRYVESCGAGIAVRDEGQHAVADGLRALVSSEAIRKELGARGLEVALANHDAERQRREFRDLLAKAAEGRISERAGVMG